MEVTTDPHYYIATTGEEFTVNGYRFEDKMGRYLITDTENRMFSDYDSKTVWELSPP